jgi:hypothetical protein
MMKKMCKRYEEYKNKKDFLGAKSLPAHARFGIQVTSPLYEGPSGPSGGDLVKLELRGALEHCRSEQTDHHRPPGQ